MLRTAPVVLLLLLLLPVTAVVGRAAGPAPRPPCGGPAEPRFAAVGTPPNVAVWHRGDLPADWRAPDCLGWPSLQPRLVVALAAEFNHVGTLDGLLDRIGAFSAYKSIPYWSASRGSWQPLTKDARLLTGPDGPPAGRDLRAADFRTGMGFAYVELGYTVQGMTVRQRDERRVVLTVENLAVIRMMLVPMFDAGALRSAILIERADPAADRWRYFHMLVADDGASQLALSAPESYVNRLTAFYRYVAGLPKPAQP